MYCATAVITRVTLQYVCSRNNAISAIEQVSFPSKDVIGPSEHPPKSVDSAYVSSTIHISCILLLCCIFKPH